MAEQPDDINDILARAIARNRNRPAPNIPIIGGPHDGGRANDFNPAGITIPAARPGYDACYRYCSDGAYHYTRTVPRKEIGKRITP